MPSDALLLPRSLCACPPVGSIIAWRIYSHPRLTSPKAASTAPPSLWLGDREGPGGEAQRPLAGRGTLRFQRWRPRGDSLQRAHGRRVAAAVKDLAVKVQMHLGDPLPAMPPLNPRP